MPLPPANFQIGLDELSQRHDAQKIAGRRQKLIQIDGIRLLPRLLEAVQLILEVLPFVLSEIAQAVGMTHGPSGEKVRGRP